MPGPTVEDYGAKVAENRALKDESFRSSSDSPIPPGKKNTLLPLAYYPVDETYAVPAELEMSQDRSRLKIPTSTGKLRDYERVGTLRFSLKGQRMQLTAFSELGQRVSRLFVPFADTTSGEETYAAGRYMELDPTATGIYVSTSTAPITPSATTTRNTTARSRRPRIGWTCRFAPANGSRNTHRRHDERRGPEGPVRPAPCTTTPPE